ncbi:hypothetical protein GCM10010124_05200 [Pilimelia terevasa]|uniref:GerMN domain-containing protein n=1 Tax=Pilimelia terevasa TaxID=53372 RepID=A0A8J3BN18_9ACTN|nr:LpqB family beta-propeller domain-containing protein [Pilimelia terevasa]GGK15436.1 hypothetical protein GCM10010124_05200 [Pilimelia terevasa]
MNRARPRTRAALSALSCLALLSGLAGCGLPGTSDVVVQERVGDAALPAGDEGTWPLAQRASVRDPKEFMRTMLSAAAGDPVEAAKRVRSFGDAPLRSRWEPPATVHVVDLDEDMAIDPRPGGFEATINVTFLGELADHGVVLPRPRRAATYKFDIAEGPDGLYLTAAPPVILLPAADLRQYFEQRTLYFWSADGAYLVPDVRYVPRRDMPRNQWPTLLVQWLLRGPSPLLRPVVRALPTDADLVGNVLSQDSRWSVNLTQAPDTDGRRLATQLRWTLAGPTGRADAVTVRVDRDRFGDEDSRYLVANPAYRAEQEPARLCLLAGRVQQIGGPSPGAVSVPYLPAGYRGLVRAAYQRFGSRRYGVLVRDAGRGRLAVDVATADANRFHRILPTALRARVVGQPTWVPTREFGLVPVDGALRLVRPSAAAAPVLPGAPGGVTAVAVAPDGRRVVLVAGGQLYAAALVADGTAISLTARTPLPLSELTGPTAVAWTAQGAVAVAGRQPRIGQTQVWSVSVDGAVQEPLQLPNQGLGTQPITQLSAVVDDPSDTSPADPVMYEANKLSYDTVGGSPVTVAELLDPGPGADRRGYPTAPFYLG